ncbi:hypothetical protein [Cylindrospermum sp. FACHB-282]|uniref:hypothetical protein n=1 Tax=Cylindrospermum sp. FACHB-282 TaxID=2692794 RepID=UPI001683050A|nr:hypothetical protein [Cylindrospermum sp. FACHB-282]MBD2387469.1 hypothetical protein [Cylindrospermum sp. FACHB-282]
MQSINLEELFNLISVRPPYFALENLELNENGTLSADIPIQQPLGMEAAVISAAETGRHLAILGACCIAIFNPNQTKHYYLAHNAEFISNPYQPDSEIGNYVRGTAQGFLLNKRSAVAITSITNKLGITINSLKIYYHVIPEKVFIKIYKKFQTCTNFEMGINPYKKSLSLQSISIVNNKLKASIGTVLSEDCTGHFPDFPAIPVAILANILIGATGYLLKNILQEKEFKYIVVKVLLRAENLAFSGEIVNLEVNYLYTNNNEYVFSCIAITDCMKQVGNLCITLSPVTLTNT